MLAAIAKAYGSLFAIRSTGVTAILMVTAIEVFMRILHQIHFDELGALHKIPPHKTRWLCEGGLLWRGVLSPKLLLIWLSDTILTPIWCRAVLSYKEI